LAGASVLDYGCGSGILAIAAARLGATRVIGLDIDPEACRVARENAQQNGCEFIEMVLPAALPAGQFDVLVANILLNPLLALASQLADLVKPGGQIGLSGLLAEQAEFALAAYAPWFDLNPPEYREEWAFVGGRRRP
jgi:ribosomal protein L11 methyltransferase